MWRRRIGWVLIGLVGAMALLPGAIVGALRLWWRFTDPERFETTSFLIHYDWWAWPLIGVMGLGGAALIWSGRLDR